LPEDAQSGTGILSSQSSTDHPRLARLSKLEVGTRQRACAFLEAYSFAPAAWSRYHISLPWMGLTAWHGRFAEGSRNAVWTISAFPAPSTRNMTLAPLFSTG